MGTTIHMFSWWSIFLDISRVIICKFSIPTIPVFFLDRPHISSGASAMLVSLQVKQKAEMSTWVAVNNCWSTTFCLTKHTILRGQLDVSQSQSVHIQLFCFKRLSS